MSRGRESHPEERSRAPRRGRGQFFLRSFFSSFCPIPRERLPPRKRRDFQTTKRCAFRPFPFPDDSRRRRRVGGRREEVKDWHTSSARGCFLFYARAVAGISHKSREKPGAFEPSSFTVSPTTTHPSSPPPPPSPLPPSPRSIPPSSTPTAPSTGPSLSLPRIYSALRLTTNFSSDLFVNPRAHPCTRLTPAPLPALPRPLDIIFRRTQMTRASPRSLRRTAPPIAITGRN